ncbi:hypothetical protein ONZ51_g5734 [Trametes cubensis]|uniref:Uncharacterized protein n=1 Tax=Trametes cubensis TaxID=1111947 RepID=A0AAD7TTI7_9APHY|nr:hypothetical protein ONZ51_g5734 [Trametes cubensis]
MSIAAHYPSAPSAAPADRRGYPDIHSAYDPSSYFSHYSPPSLSNVAASSLDAGYSLNHSANSSGASYSWDAHDPGAVQSASYPSSSSTSVNAYHHHSATPASSVACSVVPSNASYSAYSAHSDSYSSASANYPASRSINLPSPSSTASARTSARAVQSSGARSYSSLAAAAAATTSTTGSSSTPRLQNATWDSAGLYTIDPADPVSQSPGHHAYTHSPATSPPRTPVTPPIKEEDAEGEFIIEVSVPADPVPSTMPEVPLRAIHAPPRQRKMMYSFRLDSFATHDGIHSAAKQPGAGGIEVGPLRQRPVEFEWQVELSAPLVPDDENTARYWVPSSPKQSGQKRRRMASSTAPRRAQRVLMGGGGSVSPALSLEYQPGQLDSDPWDGSSSGGYASVAENGSGSATAATSSPTFAPIMTPAQSLGWSMRYQTAEVDLEPSTYHRQHAAQPSLSRVSQPSQSAFVFSAGSSSKSSYDRQQHQAQTQSPAYGYESGYSRSSGRYAEVYASSSSSNTGWYRE